MRRIGKTRHRIGMTSFLWVVFIVLVGYLLIQHVSTSHPAIAVGVTDRVITPLQQVVKQGVMVPLQRILPLRRYTPNPYGYGGLDPSGGERKGGDGRGIPDAVEVGWWKGEEVTYPERRLSPVQDEASTPPEPRVADVGWWGDDWLA